MQRWGFLNEKILAQILLTAALVVNVAGLAPELTISRVDLNDNAFHYPLVQGMVQAIEQGRNPLDWWAPEWTLGYPVLRTYQPLAHGIVALSYFALGKTVSLMTVFVWVRFLSVVFLPLSFFACARLLGLPPLTSAAAAMLSPLISTSALYGLEYGSYLWAGSGLFTQAVASHFLLLSIGFGFRAIRRGRLLAITGALVGLTFLAHFIYGYMAALTVCLLAVLPAPETTFWIRLRRAVWIGATALLLSAFELIPLLQDSPIINRSRWEYAWKWDSFGAGQVLKWLFTGELLDHGRWPVLTLLAFGGAMVFLYDFRRGRKDRPARVFVALGAAFWILMFFGRPFWGPALTLLAVPSSLQLHRVIGAAQVFLVLLAAIGLAGFWRWSSRRAHVTVAIAGTALLFYPMVRERARYLANNTKWGDASLEATNEAKPAIDTAIAIAKQRGGRAYAGLAAGWGGSFKIGDPPFYAYLSEAQVPALSFLFHSMALTSDIMVRFNEADLSQYNLFNIKTVIAPVENAPVLPGFLKLLRQTGPLRIFGVSNGAVPNSAASGGYFDVVDARFAVHTTRDNLYDINDRWLASDWVAKKQHLLLDLGGAPAGMDRLPPGDALPEAPSAAPAGSIRSEREHDGVYEADAEVTRPSFVLFKMTWHPDWHAYVNGKLERTVMLSPGFTGVPVAAGAAHIRLVYQPEAWKAWLAIFDFVGVIGLIAGERRNVWERLGGRAAHSFGAGRWPALAPAWRKRLLVAGGLLLLASPVSIPLATARLPAGHDALEYLPRLVEFHQNIAHGILLPRWAPDLSGGAGQPLFLFNPPLFYYLAELWHLAGFDFIRAINLASAAIVIASAAGMFLLGRLYFGEAGGFTAAAAYLYSPYFAVDLYVRSALAEFAAFPFFAFTLYGLGAHAKSGKRKFLLLGAAGYAGILLCHNPAALLFTPLLLAFAGFNAWSGKSWHVLLQQGGALLLGLGLSAFVWLPSLAERQFVQLGLLLQGYLRYSNHFMYLHQLFYSPWGYGLSVAGDRDGMSFSLGWEHLAVAAIACVWAARIRRERRYVFFFMAAAAALSYFTLTESAWLWNRVQLLQFVEFPWRLLGPVSVCLALACGAAGSRIWRLPRWRAPAFACLLAVLIIPNLSHLAPGGFHDLDLAFWTPEQIARRGVAVATAEEYKPRWSSSSVESRDARVVSGSAAINETAKTPVSWSGIARVESASVIQVPVAYFPGWEIRVDGQPRAAVPGGTPGLLQFDVPAGVHRVDAIFARTRMCWTGDALGAFSWLIFFVLACTDVRLPFERRAPRAAANSGVFAETGIPE